MTAAISIFIFGLVGCMPVMKTGQYEADHLLYDRGMLALKQKKTDVACATFKTLISTYPKSEYVAPAREITEQSWCRNVRVSHDY